MARIAHARGETAYGEMLRTCPTRSRLVTIRNSRRPRGSVRSWRRPRAADQPANHASDRHSRRPIQYSATRAGKILSWAASAMPSGDPRVTKSVTSDWA